jgi:hypothetical protein
VREQREVVVENQHRVKCYVAVANLANNIVISILLIAQGLYKLAVNEKTRNQIYFKFNLKEILKNILEKSEFYFSSSKEICFFF